MKKNPQKLHFLHSPSLSQFLALWLRPGFKYNLKSFKNFAFALACLEFAVLRLFYWFHCARKARSSPVGVFEIM